MAEEKQFQVSELYVRWAARVVEIAARLKHEEEEKHRMEHPMPESAEKIFAEFIGGVLRRAKAAQEKGEEEGAHLAEDARAPSEPEEGAKVRKAGRKRA
jgi:hypothetical protein